MSLPPALSVAAEELHFSIVAQWSLSALLQTVPGSGGQMSDLNAEVIAKPPVNRSAGTGSGRSPGYSPSVCVPGGLRALPVPA